MIRLGSDKKCSGLIPNKSDIDMLPNKQGLKTCSGLVATRSIWPHQHWETDPATIQAEKYKTLCAGFPSFNFKVIKRIWCEEVSAHFHFSVHFWFEEKIFWLSLSPKLQFFVDLKSHVGAAGHGEHWAVYEPKVWTSSIFWALPFSFGPVHNAGIFHIECSLQKVGNSPIYIAPSQYEVIV